MDLGISGSVSGFGKWKPPSFASLIPGYVSRRSALKFKPSRVPAPEQHSAPVFLGSPPREVGCRAVILGIFDPLMEARKQLMEIRLNIWARGDLWAAAAWRPSERWVV